MAVVNILFGDGGETLLAVTWTWTAIATIFFVLRTWYASREPSREHSSFFGIRWDYLAVTMAFVSRPSRLFRAHWLTIEGFRFDG